MGFEQDVLAQAWSVLTGAWTERWALIVALGSGPVLAMKLSPGWARHPGCDFVRRTGALLAVVLCLYSGYLLADTVSVDDQGVAALRTVRCEALGLDGEQMRAQCDGRLVRAVWVGGAPPGTPLEPVSAWRLPYSDELVALTPAGSAPAPGAR